MVMGKMPASPSSPAPPAESGWMFIIFGGLFCLLAWAFAGCLFLSGRWLAARRNWTFCFVVACLSCMNVPLGTILGVFTILVLQRPGMTPQRFEAILDHQMPDAEKRARADFVIPTDVSLDETRATVRRILACLKPAADS